MYAQNIADEIERIVKGGYGSWTIGITDNLARRKGEHDSDGEDTRAWTHWQAVTEGAARNVEKHFLDLGMKGGVGGPSNGTYVYIY